MKILSKFLCESQNESSGGKTLLHWCPGCDSWHMVDVEKPNVYNAKWTWNGDVEKPTLSPSVNCVGRCHYFLRDGMLSFCSDSKHALAGKTVPLPEIPEQLRSMIEED